MTPSSLEEKIAAVTALQKLWALLLPNVPMFDVQFFHVWATHHSVETMEIAITKTARKYRLMNGDMTPEHMFRYCSSIANAKTFPKHLRKNPPAPPRTVRQVEK